MLTKINYSVISSFWQTIELLKEAKNIGNHPGVLCSIVSAFEIFKKGLHTHPLFEEGFEFVATIFYFWLTILILYFLLPKSRNQKGSFCQRGWTVSYPLAIRLRTPNSLKKRSRGNFQQGILIALHCCFVCKGSLARSLLSRPSQPLVRLDIASDHWTRRYCHPANESLSSVCLPWNHNLSLGQRFIQVHLLRLT